MQGVRQEGRPADGEAADGRHAAAGRPRPARHGAGADRGHDRRRRGLDGGGEGARRLHPRRLAHQGGKAIDFEIAPILATCSGIFDITDITKRNIGLRPAA